MKKRAIAILLATSMLMGTLAGCGNKSDSSSNKNVAPIEVAKEGYPVVKEQITFNALGFGEPGCGEWNEFPIFQKIEDRCGIDVQWQTVSGEGADEKLNLILASAKNLPDMIFSGLSGTKISSYAKKGIIRPMDDLIDNGYAPNLKKIFDENPNIRKAITMPDGHIYSLPSINDPDPVMTTTLNINKDWCDKLGVNPEDIKTIADFEKLLERFAKEDPNGNGENDEIPFSFEAAPPYHVWNGDADFSGAFGVMTDWDPIMLKDDKIVFSQGIEEYKTYVKWFAEMYTTGRIDKEVFTHDHNQYMAKIDAGKVGAYLTNGPVVGGKCEYVAILPLEGPAGRLWGAQDTSLDKGRGLITTACKYPEAAMRFIDSFYEIDNTLELRYGIYLVDAEGGKKQVLPTEPGKPSQAPGSYVATKLEPDLAREYLVPTELDLMAEARKKAYAPYLMDPVPLLNYTAEESKELSNISADITKYANEQKAKWCTGQGNIDAEWDSYLNNLKNLQLDRYMEIHNNAYNRFKGNN